jgi:hypothetical protein
MLVMTKPVKGGEEDANFVKEYEELKKKIVAVQPTY